MNWLLTALVSLLLENLIFTQALGTSTLMAAARNRSRLPLLAALMTIFSTLASMLLQLLYFGLGLAALPEEIRRLVQPLSYTAVVSLLYGAVLLVSYRFLGERFAAFKKYVHLSAFNCAVMGTLYLAFPADRDDLSFRFLGNVLADRHTLTGAMLFGLQEGLGFLLAAVLISAVRERLYAKEVPAAFRGFPAAIVFIGLLSMAVYSIVQ